MDELPQAVAARLSRLPKGLRAHVERAREVSRTLSARHGVDEQLADVGVAAHDLARAMSPPALTREARRLGLAIDAAEAHSPLLLHGPIAAEWLRREGGIAAEESVLESVRFHTTGKLGMGKLAKVVFLADKLDPWKARQSPFLNEVADLARSDLDSAILCYLDNTVRQLIEDGQMVHPVSVSFRDWLIERMKVE